MGGEGNSRLGHLRMTRKSLGWIKIRTQYAVLEIHCLSLTRLHDGLNKNDCFSEGAFPIRNTEGLLSSEILLIVH